MILEGYKFTAFEEGLILEKIAATERIDSDLLKSEEDEVKDIYIAKVISVGGKAPEDISVGDLVIGENWALYRLSDNLYATNYHNIIAKAESI